MAARHRPAEYARERLDGPADGNAVVIRRLLAEQDVEVPLRTWQRALAPHPQARRTAELATVRFEPAPGDQKQIDFSEKWLSVAGVRTLRRDARPSIATHTGRRARTSPRRLLTRQPSNGARSWHSSGNDTSTLTRCDSWRH
jgi:hypothetical protein